MNGHPSPLPDAGDEMPIDPRDLEPLEFARAQDMVLSWQAAQISLENAAMLLGLMVATGCLLCGLPLDRCAVAGFFAGSLGGISAETLATMIEEEILDSAYPR